MYSLVFEGGQRVNYPYMKSEKDFLKFAKEVWKKRLPTDGYYMFATKNGKILKVFNAGRKK